MRLEDQLLTEASNPASESIDQLDALGLVAVMHAEDEKAVAAVKAAAAEVARTMDRAAKAFQAGGRLIYVGAGTSGRLGVLDASECPPTFNTPPSMVVGLIAGGREALVRAIEGAEDRADQGVADLARLEPGSADLVIGIATSGRTPYVIGALDEARRSGATAVALVCNQPSVLDAHADWVIPLLVGPEVISGSTRLKAGTATKLVLNMISTGAMVRIGKTFGNRMIDLQPTNEKLRIRTRRILRELTGLDDAGAASLLEAAGGRLKPALVASLAGVDLERAESLLERHHGRVRDAVRAVTGVDPR
jgi:N-acetylmuramic acid 6-phosphate etherase